MDETKILLVDDDNNICDLIEMYFYKEGFKLFKTSNGKDALKIIEEKQIDIVVLDVMMPQMDVYELLKEIRKISLLPVLILTTKAETIDSMLGLELGVDDYIIMPFEPREMIAKLKKIICGYKPKAQERALEFVDLVIDADSYLVKYKGNDIEMPSKEFELLYFLTFNSNQVFTSDQLLHEVWGDDYPGDSRTVDVHMKRIMEKLLDQHEWQFKTVWGIGYKFEVK